MLDVQGVMLAANSSRWVVGGLMGLVSGGGSVLMLRAAGWSGWLLGLVLFLAGLAVVAWLFARMTVEMTASTNARFGPRARAHK